MRTLGIFLILIALLTTTSAIVIEELDPDILIIDPESELNQERDLQILQRMASLENKFNNIATKADVTAATTFIFNNLSQDFENKTDFLIIALLLGNIFTLAIFVTIFLILKSRRRL